MYRAPPSQTKGHTCYCGTVDMALVCSADSVSKLYNDPLLRTTISIVAAQEGAPPEKRAEAVSTALLLALVVGVMQGAAFFALAGPVLSAMSVTPASPMRQAVSHAAGSTAALISPRML